MGSACPKCPGFDDSLDDSPTFCNKHDRQNSRPPGALAKLVELGGMEKVIQDSLDEGFEIGFSNDKEGVVVEVGYQPSDSRCGKTTARQTRMDCLSDAITLEETVESLKLVVLRNLKEGRIL